MGDVIMVMAMIMMTLRAFRCCFEEFEKPLWNSLNERNKSAYIFIDSLIHTFKVSILINSAIYTTLTEYISEGKTVRLLFIAFISSQRLFYGSKGFKLINKQKLGKMIDFKKMGFQREFEKKNPPICKLGL